MALENPVEAPVADTVVTLKRAPGHRNKAQAVYRRQITGEEKKTQSGIRLLQRLNQVMAQKGDSVDDVAAKLGISTTYLRAIANGGSSFANVNKQVLRKAAEYIDLPVAQTFLLADAMEPGDFFYASSIDKELTLAYVSMTAHPMWAGYAPSTEEWDAMSTRQKLFTCMLYENATSQQFLSAAAVTEPKID